MPNKVIKEKICLALGFFDSVHFGHRVIIERTKKAAQKIGAKTVVSTFSDKHYTDLRHGEKLVYTFVERCELFSELEVDSVLSFDFDEKFRMQSAEEFLLSVLNKYDVKHIVCGYDYRFGRNGCGNVDVLKGLCARYAITYEIVDEIKLDEIRVSSTAIKAFLSSGNMKSANKLLVDEYFIRSVVVGGRGEGRLNGVPTANILLDGAKLIPKKGVYSTVVFFRDEMYPSVTNVGEKPTYGDDTITVETFICGFDGDLYDTEIKIIFYEFLREIRKFADKRELMEQIYKDLDRSKDILCYE